MKIKMNKKERNERLKEQSPYLELKVLEDKQRKDKEKKNKEIKKLILEILNNLGFLFTFTFTYLGLLVTSVYLEENILSSLIISIILTFLFISLMLTKKL